MIIRYKYVSSTISTGVHRASPLFPPPHAQCTSKPVDARRRELKGHSAGPSDVSSPTFSTTTPQTIVLVVAEIAPPPASSGETIVSQCHRFGVRVSLHLRSFSVQLPARGLPRSSLCISTTSPPPRRGCRAASGWWKSGWS